MNKNKLFYLSVWLVLLALAPITIYKSLPSTGALREPVILLNVLQRLLGLWAFTLLFTQIVLGAFMQKLTEKVGGWLYSFHALEGVIVYFLILSHPMVFVIFNYFLGKGIDPFYVFTEYCIFCKNITEFYYTLGRLSFLTVTLTVFAGFFRTINPFMRRHWRKVHVLNYLVFIMVAAHSFSVGSDVGVAPFSYFFLAATISVFGIIIYKLYQLKTPSGKQVDEVFRVKRGRPTKH
jgi:predicted ferric reductase